jgi:hypothetical protein
MSTTVNSGGRFGNQFIRNIALSLLAEKHDLHTIASHFNNELDFFI